MAKRPLPKGPKRNSGGPYAGGRSSAAGRAYGAASRAKTPTGSVPRPKRAIKAARSNPDAPVRYPAKPRVGTGPVVRPATPKGGAVSWGRTKTPGQSVGRVRRMHRGY